jgi:hypothetical protein
MKNTTISLDEITLELAKKAASVRGLSFNAYIKELLDASLQNQPQKIVEELIDLSKKIQGDSKGKSWSKDQIYER